MEKIESSGVPEDRDVSKTSKEEFSSAVNRQKGRVSRKLVEKNLYIISEYLNNNGIKIEVLIFYSIT